MATFDLGRVTPLYKGDYSASTSYELNDVVLYNGSLYWHVQATATVGILPTDTTVWKLAFSDEGVRAEIRGYADDAQASKSAAAQSASQASASASSAQASASQAALSAQSASTKASEASTSAQTASTKASEASASAQSAASSAQTATDKATLASQKAAAASESATLATARASAAATSETNAAASAQTATAKASEAAASATSAQEYDESAQASAVNAQTAQGLAETAQTAAETAQGLAEDARDLAQQYAESIDPEHIYSAYPTDTVSGAVASFADGADDIPLKSLVVNIDPVQDTSSGDPSPTNICPISGWTGIQLNANGTVIPISWQTEAGTVYGGKLDVLSGVLTVTHKSYTFNGTEQFGVSTNSQVESFSYFRWYSTAFTNVITDWNTYNDAILSDYRIQNQLGYWYSGGIASYGGGNCTAWTVKGVAGLCIRNDAYSDVATFKASLIGMTMVYKLASPITYSLTPQEITSLLGTNNLWADSGDTEVEYRADTKLYIERLTEPDADMIADANITSGSYFMVGNTLYKATANIASGSAVIEGTNATRKSLSEALNEINQ